MGHQVNFYLSQADASALEEKFRSAGDYLAIHSRSDTGRPRILENLNCLENDKPWLYFFLVRPEHLDSVVMRPVPAQGYWTVDVLKSPVIEYTKCFLNEEMIRRGRIYYVDSFYENEILMLKDEMFREWAKKILSITRKSLKKTGAEYFGLETFDRLSTSGIKLVQ